MIGHHCTASDCSSVITLANSAIGAGVLAFPYAFKASRDITTLIPTVPEHCRTAAVSTINALQEAGFAAALIVTVGLCLV